MITEEQLRSASAWLKIAANTMTEESPHSLAHLDKLEAALEALQKWQHAENRTADARKASA